MNKIYPDELIQRSKTSRSIISMGIDPVISDIPLSGKRGEIIVEYFINILNEIGSPPDSPAIIKPNIAFFEQFGIEGIEALRTIIKAYKEKGFQILLDAKRGDIGKTSEAYAVSLFDYFKADAVTVNPYLGVDGLLPFFEYCSEGKGVYVLIRTSNKGADRVQNIDCGGTPLYLKIVELFLENYREGMGFVCGATYLEEMDNIFSALGNINLPILIPGIGTQGGDIVGTVKIIEKRGFNPLLVRINASSSITYAWKKSDKRDYAKAARDELRNLNTIPEIVNLLNKYL